MKFGRVDPAELEHADISLPEDHPDNEIVLSGKEAENCQVYVGCAKWGRKEWVGLIYPEGTKEKDFLDLYIQHFNSIELNSTFYNLKKANIESWSKAANGTSFKFCPKVSRRISHIKRLNDCDENIQYFVDMCLLLGDNLGLPFLQMPENFSAKYMDRIASFLKFLPDGFPMAVEVRHESWFEGNAFNEFFHLLNEYDKTPVITDTIGRRDVIHQRLTSSKIFIRFNGYEGHPSDAVRVKLWADRIALWVDKGMEEVYFFAHQPDEAYTPGTAEIFIREINRKTGLEIKSPFS